jgi:hypothetical protein
LWGIHKKGISGQHVICYSAQSQSKKKLHSSFFFSFLSFPFFPSSPSLKAYHLLYMMTIVLGYSLHAPQRFIEARILYILEVSFAHESQTIITHKYKKLLIVGTSFNGLHI